MVTNIFVLAGKILQIIKLGRFIVKIIIELKTIDIFFTKNFF